MADPGGVLASPCPVAPMYTRSACRICIPMPSSSDVPASSALPALLCREVWREGLRMGIAAQVSRADNYFWGKDAVF